MSSHGFSHPSVLARCLALLSLLTPCAASALTLEVVDGAGNPITGFRWLLEEDLTRWSVPGVSTPEALAYHLHPSHMPVVARGDDTTAADIPADPAKRYFLSVLPAAGFSIGGAAIAPGQATARVVLVQHPIPTAQITVFVYEDDQPINNAADLPAEVGLAGFSIILEEPGGRYGMAGGQVTQDAFGNPLGTTYQADADGNPVLDAEGAPVVATLGSGIILTDANGRATIQNLSPGKYGVIAQPPVGDWVQTSTIEGTKVIDAWVKANEPAYFQEFGTPGFHVEIGFVRPFVDDARLTGGSTITGQVVNMHLSRPPDYGFYNGAPVEHTNCWVGLNELGVGVLAQPCGPEGTFEIPNVPPGQYQLVVWDDNLDFIFALTTVTVPDGGGELALGDVPVFQWFSRLEHHVFNDVNENGQWDDGEIGLPEVPVNIRWRDGTMYQSFPTDGEGFVPFDEVFPFFAWLVAEVDFARYKATGVTVVVDAGGPIDPTDPWTFGGKLNPQPQPDNFGLPYRVETGPVLTQGFQGFLGQTSVLMWGKAFYGPGENGGISGIVYYDTTRAEDDPQFATPEEWQPGIPRVQVNLYRDADGFGDGIPDDIDGVPGFTPPDVDNYPLGWQDDPLALPGPEDVDRDGDGAFDLGDALQAVHTDSWDDNLPTGCVGDPADPFYLDGRCFDGLRNWNQVRPAVFDGGYAFSDVPAGIYIVESIPPRSAVGPTYQTVRAEDRNVDFGDPFVPAMGLMALALPQFPNAMCVGTPENGTAPYVVGPRLSLFPDANIEPGLAGAELYGCERKQVFLSEGTNGAADFFMFTEVPIAGHIVGFVLDDTANEFDINAPTFGEKFAPPWMPISIRDATGREISRVYSDEYGTYSALVPSTYTMDRPMPSGVSPNMLTACMNDPTKPDPSAPGGFVFDPYFNRQYSQFCYTFQYVPGATTYLDTPVVRIAAFAGGEQFPLDCEPVAGEPRIFSVSSPLGGPYVTGGATSPNRILTIVSEGTKEVPNPAYDPALGTPRLVARDYGFGTAPGTVVLGDRLHWDNTLVNLPIVSWSPDVVRVRVPAGAPNGRELVLTRANGRQTREGVTVTVGGPTPLTVAPGGSIQAAIDAAPPNSTLFVPPGTYFEPLILWKPIRLQGWGAGSTIINAVKAPAEKLAAWRVRVQTLLAQGAFTLLPGQEAGPNPTEVEPLLLFNEEGSGVLVLSRNVSPAQGGFGLQGGIPNARVDGFTITGADHAGGVTVNGYARQLQISNNRIVANAGVFGGGVRIGHPLQTTIEDSFNDGVSVVRNHVVANGSTDGAGGGIALYTGADDYWVTFNRVCGNFTLGEGGGIGHLGHSENGHIEWNHVLFNQSFNQGLGVSGGGIFVGGEIVPGADAGSGHVRIIGNHVQGNLAGAGDGGGIRVSRSVGLAELNQFPNTPAQWHHVEIYSNFLVNNVAALAGGGISLQDAPRVTIAHNTIANNDSVATAGAAFAPGVPFASVAQPAGVVSRAHSADLAAAFGNGGAVQSLRYFSNPTFRGNLVWQNRSQFFMVDDSVYPARSFLVDRLEGPYWDLAVLGTLVPEVMDPRFCLLTDPTGYHTSNRTGDPLFVATYRNGARNAVVIPEVTTAIAPVPAFDEGGNFIDVRFGPLTLNDPSTGLPFGNYHILPGSPAVRGGGPTVFYDWDIDDTQRPNPAGTRIDIGGDEIPQ